MLRSLALDNMFSNLDSYINSARNYYLYHDSTTFKWNWIKWDANEAFGSYGGQGVGNLLNLAPNYAAANRHHLTRIFGIEALNRDYLVQYCAAMDNFTNAHLDPKIDAIEDLIAAHVAADPNKQYTTAQFTQNITSNINTGGGPGGGTIYGLKSFIAGRSSYLNGALDCTTVGIAESKEFDFSVHPNPVTNVLYVEHPSSGMVKSATVFDAVGQRIHLTTDGRSMDVSTLAPGMYILTVVHDGRAVSTRFLKE
jgi:hypothetical protein